MKYFIDKNRQPLLLGNAIRAFLKRRGMTQGDLSRATGLERSYVSALACNKIQDPRLSTMFKVVKALGVTVSELVALAIRETNKASHS
jgi:transcriptional regulator with XRE-family HTH domain